MSSKSKKSKAKAKKPAAAAAVAEPTPAAAPAASVIEEDDTPVATAPAAAAAAVEPKQAAEVVAPVATAAVTAVPEVATPAPAPVPVASTPEVAAPAPVPAPAPAPVVESSAVTSSPAPAVIKGVKSSSPVTVYPNAAAAIASSFVPTTTTGGGKRPPASSYGTVATDEDLAAAGSTETSRNGSVAVDVNERNAASDDAGVGVVRTSAEYIGPQSKTQSAAYFSLLFIAFIGVMLGWGAPLHSLTKNGDSTSGPLHIRFMMNKYYTDEASGTGLPELDSYSECTTLTAVTFGYADAGSACESCMRGSKGMGAVGAFAWIALFVNIILVAMRLGNKDYYVPWIGTNRQKYLRTESVLTILACFLYFLLVTIWADTCWKSIRIAYGDYNTGVVVGSGWWFLLICWFFMIMASIISVRLNGNPCFSCNLPAAVTSCVEVQPDVRANGPFGTKCDKALNIILLVCVFLAFIASCVGMGGEMQHLSKKTIIGTQTLYFYWSSFSFNGVSQTFAQCISADNGQTALGGVLRNQYCTMCQSGGQAFLGCTVMAFLGLLIQLILCVIRISNRIKLESRFLSQPLTFLRMEDWASHWAWIWMIIAAMAWGGTCYQITVDHFQDVTTDATGFGYYLFAVVVMTFVVALVSVLRRRAGEIAIEAGDDAANGGSSERAALRASQPSLPAVSSVYAPLPNSAVVASPIDSADSSSHAAANPADAL